MNNGKEHNEDSQEHTAGEDAFAVIDAFKRQTTLMGELAMGLDFFTNGEFVLTGRQGNSRLGRAVGNTDKDDTTFLKSEMRKRIGISHKKYEYFRQQLDKKSERLKSIFRYLKQK